MALPAALYFGIKSLKTKPAKPLPAAPVTPRDSASDTTARSEAAAEEMRRRARGGIASTMFAGQSLAYDAQRQRVANRLLGGGG